MRNTSLVAITGHKNGQHALVYNAFTDLRNETSQEMSTLLALLDFITAHAPESAGIRITNLKLNLYHISLFDCKITAFYQQSYLPIRPYYMNML
jgi:hypothetical protein